MYEQKIYHWRTHQRFSERLQARKRNLWQEEIVADVAKRDRGRYVCFLVLWSVGLCPFGQESIVSKHLFQILVSRDTFSVAAFVLFCYLVNIERGATFTLIISLRVLNWDLLWKSFSKSAKLFIRRTGRAWALPWRCHQQRRRPDNDDVDGDDGGGGVGGDGGDDVERDGDDDYLQTGARVALRRTTQKRRKMARSVSTILITGRMIQT